MMHIAIMGCGQLARMMALAGWRLGHRFTFIADPDESTQCIDGLGNVVRLQPGLKGGALFEALGEPQVITVEREHVDVSLLKSLQDYCQVSPSPKAIATCQDRGSEKRFLAKNKIPTSPFYLAYDAAEMSEAVQRLGYPCVIKTCQQGYDGKGQWVLKGDTDLGLFLQHQRFDQRYLVEAFIPFEQEVSIIAARTGIGQTAFYPLTENQHQQGILVASVAPALLPDALTEQAQTIANRILEELDYIGVLTIEFFVTSEGLMVNELAPRVHNSGHWTQSAGICSQFENHLRCIGLQALGNTEPASHAAMVNLLGRQASEQLLNVGNVELHQYNKTPKPNRKLGHINLWSVDRQQLLAQVADIRENVYGGIEP
ncbi:5-(carboxyamino)imidazole ribonucleotide synthase [Paraferrimonas sedimenticola]|uniref:N5-carboxyaminoimidazole ribonucleotide synthase n=1 Tax=Paraferrimonas sedimenticola TaxID=375674 RepID=A0AA37VWS5_9GAMM|nr:5-(carboxyamino)imidazole ribonucleotide synthase [Paraferrimonas sedimenticola]GLP95035.1 N5-carboxyaminoimidazole ribonucleotide synthase [Paraferrimonas sedimenticola]